MIITSEKTAIAANIVLNPIKKMVPKHKIESNK